MLQYLFIVYIYLYKYNTKHSIDCEKDATIKYMSISIWYQSVLLAFNSFSSSPSSIKVCVAISLFLKKNTTTPYPLLLFLPCPMPINFSPFKLPTTTISTGKSHRFLVLKAKIFLVSLMVPTHVFHLASTMFQSLGLNKTNFSWAFSFLPYMMKRWNHTTSCWPLFI